MRNKPQLVFFNAPMTYGTRSALKQIAAIEETTMAEVIRLALEAEVARYQGRLNSPGMASAGPRGE
jgi:hypothetical protein